jgi:hypothetical protein
VFWSACEKINVRFTTDQRVLDVAMTEWRFATCEPLRMSAGISRALDRQALLTKISANAALPGCRILYILRHPVGIFLSAPMFRLTEQTGTAT